MKVFEGNGKRHQPRANKMQRSVRINHETIERTQETDSTSISVLQA